MCKHLYCRTLSRAHTHAERLSAKHAQQMAEKSEVNANEYKTLLAFQDKLQSACETEEMGLRERKALQVATCTQKALT